MWTFDKTTKRIALTRHPVSVGSRRSSGDARLQPSAHWCEDFVIRPSPSGKSWRVSLDLDLIEATWEGDAPQPGGIRVALPPILRAWKRTLGAADTLRWIPDGEPFARWLDRVADSGGGEHLLTLDPITVGELHAAWGWALLPTLSALLTSTKRHDFAHAYGAALTTSRRSSWHGRGASSTRW